MNPKYLIRILVCCLPLLDSCATQQEAQAPAWKIMPLNRISRAAGAADYEQLGHYYQVQHRYPEAAAAYVKALRINPSATDALENLGVVRAMQGQYAQAVELLSRAAKLAPASAHVQNNLGYALCLLGKPQEAIAPLREATRLDPHNRKAFANLAVAYDRTGDHNGAILARRAAEQAPDSPQIASGTIRGVTPVRGDSQQSHPVDGKAPVVATGNQVQSLPVLQPGRSIPVSMATAPSPFVAAPVPADTALLSVAPVVMTQPDTGYQVSMIEISNGNGVRDMARRVGIWLHGSGFVVERLSNQKPFNVRLTQIQYRPGHAAEAGRLQALLPQAAQMVESRKLHDHIQVRLVLGRNVVADRTWFSRPRHASRRVADVQEMRVASVEEAMR